MLTTVLRWLTRSCVSIHDKSIDPTEDLNLQLEVASSYVAEAEARVKKAEALHRPNISNWYDQGLPALDFRSIKSIYGFAYFTTLNATWCDSHLDNAVELADKAKDMLSSALASGQVTMEIASKVEQYAVKALEYLDKDSEVADMAANDSFWLNWLILTTSRVDKDNKHEEDAVICSICFDNIQRGAAIISTPCSHVFHEGCLTEWFTTTKSCPLCRAKLHIVLEYIYT